MKVIPLERKKANRTIHVPLPNGDSFSAHEDEMHTLFSNPTDFLRYGEQEGLIQLALAVVYVEHQRKAANGR